MAGAFLSWGVPRDKGSRLRRGRLPGVFVDLAMLCGTVCGGELTGPDHACDLLGVSWDIEDQDPVGRVRSEAAVLAGLYGAACRALEAAAPGLGPEVAWSAGSVAQRALRQANVWAQVRKAAGLPVEVKAAGCAAFHGGRVEAALVGVTVPMAFVDMASTYPAIWSALALTAFLACERVEFEDVTEELSAFLESPDLRDQLYRREVWARWGVTFAMIEPRGEHLPAQVRWRADRVSGTVAPLDLHGGELPFHWAALAASVVEGNKAPKVVRAWRLIPVGRQRGLLPLRLPTGRLLDLVSEDLGEALVRERSAIREDTTLPDHERRRQLSLSKLFSVALCFGLPARHDRRSLSSSVDHVGHGFDGSMLAVRTRHPEFPGPDAALWLAGAVTAGCQLAVAMARRAVLDVGGTVALVATDAIAVPASSLGGLVACLGGPYRLDDGTRAVRLLTFDQLRELLNRFDELFAPWGGRAWTEVADTLSEPTVGIVFGINKLLLARKGAEGMWLLVRSSDADMGGHLVDPTATGARLEDGRLAWAGGLELRLLVANLDRQLSLALRTPDDLPDYASEPAIRPYRATTWAQLCGLRKAVGDPTVGALARYRRAETGGRGPAPMALGTSDDWRTGGEPVGLFVLDAEGQRFVAGDKRARRRVRVLSIADHLSRWLREQDPTMQGPRRGLRRPVPVFSHPALVEVVGRAGEALWASDEDPEADASVLSYGTPQLDDLRTAARILGRREVARLAGLSARKVRTFAAGGRVTPHLTAAIAAAMADSRPCRHCGGPLEGRARLWCSKRCQKAGERANRLDHARLSQSQPVRRGCPSCGANSDGHCAACDETWCTSCGTVLLGTARRRRSCSICGAERAS